MKIAFDISQTGNSAKAGCGYYAQSLFANFFNEESFSRSEIIALPSFGDFYFDQELQNQINSNQNLEFKCGPTHANIQEARNFWTSYDFESKLEVDIIHSNNFWCPLNQVKTKLVYTLYDLGFLLNPNEWTTEVNRIGCFDGVFKAALEADWILAISNFSKNHFLKTFPHFPENRIKTIYPSSRFYNFSKIVTQPSRFESFSSKPFWLSVGTIEPRKNQKMLVQAYSKYLTMGNETIPLVFAGGKGWKMNGFEEEVKAILGEDKVFFTGYVSDEELSWLYQNCMANLYPSYFEGFGLPVLEGMQFGAATVSSNSSSLPEVLGSAGLLLEPQDVDGWANALKLISKDQKFRENLRTLALEQSQKFDWKKSVQELRSFYEIVHDSTKR
jgi:glycosyltransferase involved in cell wall biosynthesis